MNNECIYSRREVCDILNISLHTLQCWYQWEKKELAKGNVESTYLPKPVQIMNMKGKPLRWSMDMIDNLKKYQSHIVKGRNGIYGEYTNSRVHVRGN